MFKKKNRSMGRKLFIVATLFFMYFLPVQSVHASPTAWPFIKGTAVWILNQISGYSIGKEIDKRLGQDYYKRELEELIQNSKSQLAKSAAADKAEIKKQLQQAQSLLNALHTLLYSQPSSEALAELRSDVSRILDIVAEHERRLEHLEADVRNQKERLGKLEKGPVVIYPEPEPRRDLPAPTACPTTTINMVGQVASDIPGTPLQLCQAVTSVIDRNTRPIDVYSIQLQVGQSVRFRIQCNEFCSLSLWNPNTINVRSNAVGADVFTVGSNSNREGFRVYTAAVDGTYPVSIRAYRPGDRYVASVQPVQ